MMNKVFIRCTNHFDPVWRRGFKKDFYYKDEKYINESELQQICIKEWLKMAKVSDLKFDIECSLVLRNYLEANPEDKEIFQQLIKEGRFELLGAGELILDPNIPSGETYVRNLVYGFLWMEKEFGVLPKLGCVNDGFGASAQMPQIFRKCGIKWLIGLSYAYPTRDYWRGLDGSVIYIQQYFNKCAKDLGAGAYYKPCTECKGMGCVCCENTGIDRTIRMDGKLSSHGFNFAEKPFGVIVTGGEETLVTLSLPEKVKEANKNDENTNYEFMIPSDLIKFYEDDLKKVDSPEQIRLSPETEGAPNSSGCLVSRIRVKQGVRDLENRIEVLEKFFSIAFMNGSFYPQNKLHGIWEKIIFNSFHDAITGTHIDPAYDELMEIIGNAKEEIAELVGQIDNNQLNKDGRTITVFNHNSFEASGNVSVTIPITYPFRIKNENGLDIPIYNTKYKDGYCEVDFLVKDIPPLSFVELYYEKADDFETEENVNYIENEYYIIKADFHGITSIFDRQECKELVNNKTGYANELILENDFGDPWATREHDRKRTRLGYNTELISVKKYKNYSEITYKGSFKGNEDVFYPLDYRVMILEWEQKVTLFNGVKRIDFKTKINWNTFDRRIRVSFPVLSGCKSDLGSYAVPYGVMSRDRYEMSSPGWNNANGDYPAIEWFSTSAQEGINIAIFNKGTPSCRIERGEMLMSILRSPTFPNCLLWPQFYNAPVYDGMRDYGQHAFEYALYSFSGKWQDSDVVKEASTFNKKMLAFCGTMKHRWNSVKIEAKSTIISAMKKSEADDGIIIRLYEYAGKNDKISIKVPRGYTNAFITNLLEKSTESLALIDSSIKNLNIEPFEIKTIKIER